MMRAGEMTLRKLVAFAEDPGPIPSICMMAHILTPVLEDESPSLDLSMKHACSGERK